MTDATYTAVDLSRLAAPDLLLTPDYDTLFAQMVAKMREEMPDFVPRDSDPATKALRVLAYYSGLHHQRINDTARAVMPAFATGADLDHLGALFAVSRLVLTPATGSAPAIMESDEDFRSRLVLAPEGFSVAGPEGAYIFHALSAHADVLDASATSPTPGTVIVSLMSRYLNGAISPAAVDAVASRLTAYGMRPLTDHVIIQSAEVINYDVDYDITIYSGPDAGLIQQRSHDRVNAYIEANRRIGRDITRAGIIAAAHVEGVQNIILNRPAVDLVITRTQAAFCTNVTPHYAGTSE